MTLTLPEVKNWLRVDHSLDDGMITRYLVAATQQIKSAVCSANAESDVFFNSEGVRETYETCQLAVVQFWYANRSMVELPSGFDGFVHELRGMYDATLEDDSTDD
jgi:uncharacterized phage protein (predicted DNA packaging)